MVKPTKLNVPITTVSDSKLANDPVKAYGFCASPLIDQVSDALFNVSLPVFLITTSTSNNPAQVPATGLVKLIIPASFFDNLNSSNPISGVVIFLISLSTSLAMPVIGVPARFNKGFRICKSVPDLNIGLTESEFKSLPVKPERVERLL